MATPTTTRTPYGTPDDSFEAGMLDGELAAMTGLDSRRAHARIEMAADYDRMYAQGYSDGYLHATAINAARLQQNKETR
ncbi:hypothetical protein ACFV27_36910 [Streptomyces antimycoticus]|uniref:hypothetical protein n=1 Tax=Streptomyces antimycoticus TaxID=68175 RepID=UPI003681CBB2